MSFSYDNNITIVVYTLYWTASRLVVLIKRAGVAVLATYVAESSSYSRAAEEVGDASLPFFQDVAFECAAAECPRCFNRHEWLLRVDDG